MVLNSPTKASSRKVRLLLQVSSEQVDAQGRPQVSWEMLPIHCHAWTCLSIVTLEYKSSANEKWVCIICEWKEILFYPTNTKKNNKKNLNKRNIKQKNEQHLSKEVKNKQIHSQIKIHSEHLKNINKIEKYKNTELQSVNEWTHNQWRQKQIDTLSD